MSDAEWFRSRENAIGLSTPCRICLTAFILVALGPVGCGARVKVPADGESSDTSDAGGRRGDRVAVPGGDSDDGTGAGGDRGGAAPGGDQGGTMPGGDQGGTMPGGDQGGTMPGGDQGGTMPGGDFDGSVHVDNPFVGAAGYVNPQYAERVAEQAAATAGPIGEQISRLANIPTAVWIDRIAAIAGGNGVMGLRDHLEAALQQRQANTPVVVAVVVYDLPNRDCAALASNGELLIADDGMHRYKIEYIDPIAAIVGDPRYASLRIAAVIEPDSLPNLVTNGNIPGCAEAQQSGAYVEGVRYAIDSLHPLPNLYLYLDIAHSGWLGWDSNFSPAVQLYVDTVRGTAAGLASIDGFITNTANYTPTEEIYLPDPDLTVGGQPIRSATFFEWNPYFDERSFATALRNAFIDAGFPSSIGMLIDTSRNGWGGAERPSGPSTSSDLNTYADQSRLDRRPHRGGWCNQAGAGIGARPSAQPFPGIDALVWIKPPGESDGVSSDGVLDPDDPNKQFDAMCDPDAMSRYDSAYSTNALPDAPHAGRWFAEQLRMLVENAAPPL